MTLRPEQWVLLAILAVALTLLVLQVGHLLSFPAPSPAPGAAAPPAAPPLASPNSPAAPLTTPPPPPGPDSAASPATQPAVAQSAPSASPEPAAALPPEPPPPAADSPALKIRIEPPVTTARQPVTLFVTLEGQPQMTEIFFDLRYDPQRLEPDATTFAALDAMAAGESRPEMQVQVPEPGRLVARLRRSSGQAEKSPGGELCAFQFTTLQGGAATVRLVRAGIRDAQGKIIGARGGEAALEVR